VRVPSGRCWLVADLGPPYYRDGEAFATVTARVRKWHPGYWLFVLRHLRIRRAA
jgi:hypothetical protein